MQRPERDEEPEQRPPAWPEDAELRRSVNAAVQDDDADDEDD